MPSWTPQGGAASGLWGAPESVVKNAWDTIHQLQDDGSVHEIVDVSAHLARGHDITQLVKRCLISASYVVLKTPGIIYRRPGPDEYLAGISEGWDISPEHRRLEQALVSNTLHETPFCVVLPASVDVSCEAAGGDALETGMDHAAALNNEFRKLEARVYSLPVGADYTMVRRLLNQDSGGELKTGIMMPDIRNLSLKELTDLRRDYDGSFARLRYSLKGFLDGVAQFDSEKKFASVIEKIDHECRIAEDDFQRIKRKHSRSLKGMLITSSLVGVAAVVEMAVPGILAAATAALGSVTLNSVIANRLATAEKIDEMDKSDYWIAWKIHQENRRRARA